jgi:DNA-binding beta-propeller fold protein YncE
MTRTEKRLTDALRAAGNAIKDRELRPLPDRGRDSAGQRRTRQRALAAVAAAAAVALIAVFAVIPSLRHNSAPSSDAGASLVVGVGKDPTGIAVDTAYGTAYVADTLANKLSMISTSACGASSGGHCAATRSVPTDGQWPISVAVDTQTHTVYVVNAASSTVTVINAATCNATSTASCAAPSQLAQVHVGAAPQFVAVNTLTDTVYVTNTAAGTVSVIDGRTCNATNTSGCGLRPAVIPAGQAAFPIAVDQASNTVYVGVSWGVAVIDGNTCDAVSTAGCGRAPVVAPIPNLPAGLAVDDAAHTVYVSGEAGNVALLNTTSCDAADTAGCRHVAATVQVGAGTRGDAFDLADSTVYVANTVSNDVSVLNTAACNAANTAGCAATARTFPVGESPRRIAVDAANHTVYVVNADANTVSAIDSSSCYATAMTGCPTRSPAGTQPPARPLVTGPRSSCAPAETEQASGAAASGFTARDTEVTKGSVAGRAWSLWAEKGVAEPRALENGGLDLSGRWYGMCAGFPNVLETEFIDAGPHGIAYGYMAMRGRLILSMAPDGLQSPDILQLSGVSFFIGELAGSACDYPSVMLQAATPAGNAQHLLGFGRCQPGHDVDITTSSGAWGPALAPVPGTPARPGGPPSPVPVITSAAPVTTGPG